MPVDFSDFEAVDESQPTWSDFEPVAEKTNPLGETREDLINKMAVARSEGKGIELGSNLISGLQKTAEIGANPIGAATRALSVPLNAAGIPSSEFKGVDLTGALQTPLMMTEDVLQVPRGTLTGQDSPVQGVTESLEQTGTGLLKPEMLAQIPVFGASGPAAMAGKALMAGQMIKELPETARQTSEVLSDPNASVSDKAKALAGYTTQFGMAGGAAGQIVPGVKGEPIPDYTGKDLQMPEGAEPTKGTPDASENTTTTEVHGDVRPQSGEIVQEVPKQESGEGVQPSVTEKAKPEVSLAPEVQKFSEMVLDPNAKPFNKHSNATGLAVKSVDDLDALADLRIKVKQTSDDLFKTAERDESKVNQAVLLGSRAQLPREAIEVATNTGSWIEGEGLLKTNLGERPLDWKTHPEVRDWLRKNADTLKIQLPEDFPKTEETKTEVPKPSEPTEPTKSPQLVEMHAGIPIPGAAAVSKAIVDGSKKLASFTKDVAKETFEGKKSSDYRKSVLDWSAKLQRSFGEADRTQKDLIKQVPKVEDRQGIVNWIQANGDATVLADRLSKTKDPNLKKGYEAALKLTPEQIKVAQGVKAQYDSLAKKAEKYGILKSFKENYVTQLWDLDKSGQVQQEVVGANSRALRDRFRFSKASSFPTYFDGEQAGFVPRGNKDIANILPVYMHEMQTVIANRELVEQMSKGVASDGRPLLVPRGVGVPVEGEGGQATLVMPDASKTDTRDYKVLPDQPALHDWKWVSKDLAGNPVLLKADLAVHPEAMKRLKSVLGKSAISEWYNTRTTATAQIPKAIVKALDNFQSITKQSMLGLLAPFHQVQEGTHAVGHRVNPFFGIPKIDLVRDKGQMDASQHGLMLLPDRASEQQFTEGLKPSGLISKIPVVGELADNYSNYLFHQYIPGLKYKTYQSILKRNMGVFEKDLKSGKVTPEDVKITSAEQTNAAYGHLNYADLGRNPTVRHMWRLGLLAPDFLEARTRFTGQALIGLAGGKVGREQLVALGTLAVAQAALAYTSAKVTGGTWDKKDPFSFSLGNRKYTMRSVPEDITSLIKDTRQFVYNRLNPIITKPIVQGVSGVNYRGQKVSLGQTAKEMIEQPIPISARGFLGIGNTSLSGWENLMGAVGLKISRTSAASAVRNDANDWMSKSTNPKVQQAYKRKQTEVLPESVYKPIRQSIETGNKQDIVKSVRDLLSTEPDQASKEKRMKRLLRDMNPFSKPANSYESHIKNFATPSREMEQAFIKSLDAEGKERYRQAVRDQVQTYRTLTEALYGTAQYPPNTPDNFKVK